MIARSLGIAHFSLAYGAGGALESIVPGQTGAFFRRRTTKALASAGSRFDPTAYDSTQIRTHALRWRRERFESEIRSAAMRIATLAR